jgi:hypothetical protein
MDEEEITYVDAGCLRDIDYDGEVWEPASRCSRCFALVDRYYTDEHTEWHRNNDTSDAR